MELRPGRSLSVVIYDDQHGSECFDLAQTWTESGLLSASVWVPARQAGMKLGGAPHVNGRFVGVGSTADQEDLFTMIGVRRLERIRVIALQVASVGDAVVPDVMTTSKVVADALRQVLPRDDARQVGTKLTRINLIVPESARSPISQDRIQADWEINAIASPEDRPDLDRASIFVRDGVNLYAHATAAAATVGGLWPGINEGVFDDRETDSTSSESDLIVFRGSARLLLGDDPGHVLTDMVMTAVRPPSGDECEATFTWGIRAREPERVVAESTKELQKHGEWGRDLLEEMQPLTKPVLSFKTAFGEFLSFQSRLLLSAGRVIGNKAVRAAEGAATNALVGRKGDFIIRSAPQSPNGVVAYAADYMERQSQHLRADTLEIEVAKSSPPPPATWSDLRQLCFGLVDGGPLPGGFSTPQRATMREFLRPSDIAPHPDDNFVLPDGERVSPVDVNRVSALQTELSAPVYRESNDAPQGAHAKTSSTPVAEDVTIAENPATPREPSHEPKINDEAQVENLALMAEINEWLASRRNSLLWKTAEHISSRYRHANQVAKDSLARATDSSVPDASAVFAARRTLVVVWSIVIGVWFLATVVGASNYLTQQGKDVQEFDFARAIDWAVSLTIAGLSAAFIGGWKYYRALSRYEWQVRTSLAERRHAGDTFVVASREADRLSMLEHGLEDWSQVIGWIVHEPWICDESTSASLQIDPDDLPASVALAAVEPASSAIPTSLVDACVHELCTPGWMTNVFDNARELMAGTNGSEPGDRGYLDADLDGGISSRSRPDLLAKFVATVEARASIASGMRDKVHGLIAEHVLVIPAREVRRLGRFAPPDPMEDNEFFAGALGARTPFVEEIWTDSGRVKRRNLVEKSEAWLPTVRAMSDDVISVRRSSADSAVRVDFSADCEPADVKLFATMTSSTTKPTAKVDDNLSWN